MRLPTRTRLTASGKVIRAEDVVPYRSLYVPLSVESWTHQLPFVLSVVSGLTLVDHVKA